MASASQSHVSTTISLIVQIVPHTETHTTMRHWRPGTNVNLEVDVIGNHVARAMSLAWTRPLLQQP